MSARRITRREAMKTAGALVGACVLTGISGTLPTLAPTAAAQASTPSGKTLRIGFQVHRTGIGAVYGAWYEKTANAAVQYINETRGRTGRPVELVAEARAHCAERGTDVRETSPAHGGGKVAALVPIPPTETSFTKYFPQIPRDTDVVYHVMVGPGVLTFVLQMGEYFGARKPKLFGFIDSLEGVD